MTTPISVGATDLHRMLRIVNAPDCGEDGVGLPWSTLHELKALIRCTVIEFGSFDAGQEVYFFDQGLDQPDYQDELDPVFWTYYPMYCSYPERTGDYRSVIQTSDFRSLAEHRRTPIYLEYCKPHGLHHNIEVALPNGPRRELRLVLHRDRYDREFSEHDRALLTLLRPHLHAAHAEVLRRQRGIPTLTPRQWQLLQLVDAGLSNAEIARRLFISVSTVRKHLENIFGRLEVTSRTAALTRVFPARALPPVIGAPSPRFGDG
jgi:DNA-binding CsgD family transcriptional regulator